MIYVFGVLSYPSLVTKSESETKLDLFKNLLGEAADDSAEQHQGQIELESDREEENIMTIKLEREELHTIMQEAMAARENRAMGPLAAARSGGDVDERGEVFAVSIKLADFWSEDPESWFDRVDNQFAVRGIKEDATKF